MPKQKYHYSVFIGRFSPFHDGHKKVVEKALEESDYLIVVLGSDGAAPNTRNPFTTLERQRMISAATPEYSGRIIFAATPDFPYNDQKWVSYVQEIVDEAIETHAKTNPEFSYNGWTDYKHSIALAGMYKDQTSYYLNWFPQWASSVAVSPGTSNDEIISATGIRNRLFNGSLDYDREICPEVKKIIQQSMLDKPRWDRLYSDWQYEQKYEALWGKGPHVTVDTIVIQSGHILLIQRGNEYGAGLWALPGGFLNRRERILDGAIRELREETRLKVPEKVLYGSIKDQRVYDAPYRSNRSHIITHCFLIVLQNMDQLPKVYGDDDAAKAKWIPLGMLPRMEDEFMEDHFAIIDDMVGF